jgi:hypothetical protein
MARIRSPFSAPRSRLQFDEAIAVLHRASDER